MVAACVDGQLSAFMCTTTAPIVLSADANNFKEDLVDIDESTRVWVDHNDFSSVGITGDKDTYDGLLDAKHGADSLTFSWNKFHDHVSS